MEFLRALLGAELYAQVESKINEHNGNEANKDKQIKIGNLASGEYTSKAKYDALEAALAGKDTELTNANSLIAELKKGTKGNEELQGKITSYEAQVADLQKQLEDTKIKSAVKVGLLAEKCKDVDYVTYKLMEALREKGETLTLDENDNIKGWDDRLSGLKTLLPTQFESGANNWKPGDNRLPGGDNGPATVTKEQFAGMSYEQRVQLKTSNEALYKQLANN